MMAPAFCMVYSFSGAGMVGCAVQVLIFRYQLFLNVNTEQ